MNSLSAPGIRRVVLGDHAQALGGYAHATIAGGFVHVCGTSSRRADNSHAGVTIHEDGSLSFDTAAQTRAVLQNIARILAHANATLADVVDVTVYLVSMTDFAAYNQAWNEFFAPAAGPARTTVAVAALPHSHLRIEMKAVAWIGDRSPSLSPSDPTP